jgi:polysaccharide biosynthesis protein PslG
VGRLPLSRPLLAVAATALVLALASTPVAAKTDGLPPNFFGVNLGTNLTATDADRMELGGISTVRFPMDWSEVQPTGLGGYRWGAADEAVKGLAEHRIRALPMLTGTPLWVSHIQFDPPTATKHLREWSDFIRAAARRYGRGGIFWSQHLDIPYVPVTHWQVWNEPNFPQYWGGRTASAGEYVELLAATPVAIRSYDPNAKIVLAGLGPGLARPTQIPSWRFLARLYRAGAGPLIDVVADHPYAADESGVAEQLERVASVMSRYGDDSPLWVTELGWASSIVPGNHVEVGPGRQAALLEHAYRFLVHHARSLNIKRLLWFDFRDPKRRTYPPGCPKCFTFGLFHNNGSPKPAWNAFRAFTR